jgi:hypothetical protein
MEYHFTTVPRSIATVTNGLAGRTPHILSYGVIESAVFGRENILDVIQRNERKNRSSSARLSVHPEGNIIVGTLRAFTSVTPAIGPDASGFRRNIYGVFCSLWLVLTSPVTGFLVVVVSVCVLPPKRPGLSDSVCDVSQPVTTSPVKRVAAKTAVLKTFITISCKSPVASAANPHELAGPITKVQIRDTSCLELHAFFAVAFV